MMAIAVSQYNNTYKIVEEEVSPKIHYHELLFLFFLRRPILIITCDEQTNLVEVEELPKTNNIIDIVFNKVEDAYFSLHMYKFDSMIPVKLTFSIALLCDGRHLGLDLSNPYKAG